MKFSQQIMNHIAANRCNTDEALLDHIVNMCIDDINRQCSGETDEVVNWVPFELGLARKGARVRLRNNHVARIDGLDDASTYPIYVNVGHGIVHAHTEDGHMYKGCEDDLDIVEIEARSEK